jgi:hypothetical protein
MLAVDVHSLALVGLVIPAQIGIQLKKKQSHPQEAILLSLRWIPASAGMTAQSPSKAISV